MIEVMPAYRQAANRLSDEDADVLVVETARPFLLAALYRQLKRPVLVITARPDAARALAEQLDAWLGAPLCAIMPEPDALPYQRLSADLTGELDTIDVLSSLSRPAAEPPLVTASAPAMTRLLPEAVAFKGLWRRLKKGDTLSPLKLMEQLASWGYDIESLAEIPGQAARRGGIVDIYPPSGELPVRLEYFGDTIDSIRLFEPSSQRSLKPIEEFAFGPASLMAPALLGEREKIRQNFAHLDLSRLGHEEQGFFEEALTRLMEGQLPDEAAFYAPLFHRSSLLNYLPPHTLVVLDNPDAIRREIDFIHEEAEKVRQDRMAKAELPPGFPRPYLCRDELEPELDGHRQLRLAIWNGQEDSQTISMDFKTLPGYAAQLPRWIDKVTQLMSQGKRVIAVSHQAQRLDDLLEREGVAATLTEDVSAAPNVGTLTLVPGMLAGGWSMADTYLFTDSEIFGFLKQQRQARRRPVARRKLYVDVKPGDYVVHIEHGIGKFSGIITRVVDGLTREYMLLSYAEGSKLYVPTDQIDRVARYLGPSDTPPALSRLGSQEWVKS